MRSRLFLLALLLCFGAVSDSSGQVAPAPATDWRQFRGNHRLTGVAASTLPATPKLLWTFEAGDIVESSAAIADGSVYIGAGNGQLIALDLASGALRWKYTTGDLVGESSPAVGGGVVYVGDLAGTLHAVGAADGKRRWTFKAGGEIKSSPVLVNDLLLVGSYDTHLYALEAASGKLRWKVQTEGPVHATPAVLGDLAFIAGCDMKFRAIRISNGTQAYEIASGAYTAASPVTDGERVYFGTFDNEVLALDLKGRKVVWRFSDPDRQFPFYSSAALRDGRVVLGGRDRLVRAFDAATGNIAWSFAARARVDSSPVISGDRVFVGSSDNRLYALDFANGQKRWEFDAGAGRNPEHTKTTGRRIVWPPTSNRSYV
jgi:eukaryotic-like serine/threonine-protein kinase